MTDRHIPLVTIGLCTYNRADSYLREALQSAVDQTYPNLEIVVSDNCSVDHTEEVVKSFADPRIRYFKQERNLGVTSNFNFCLEQARGAYFLLLHDDDAIDPDFIQSCLTAANYRDDYGMIRTGVRWIDGDGQVMKERPNRAAGLSTEDFFRAWFEGAGVPMYLCGILFNTAWLREVGGFHSRTNLWCDLVPEVQLAARYSRLDIEDVKASFRVHATKNSWTGRVKDWCIDSRYLLDLVLDLVENPDGLRECGMDFFTRHCLRYARSVESLRHRIAAYYIVYRSFENPSSKFLKTLFAEPLASLPKRRWRRIKRGLRRMRAQAI